MILGCNVTSGLMMVKVKECGGQELKAPVTLKWARTKKTCRLNVCSTVAVASAAAAQAGLLHRPPAPMD